MAGSPDSPAGTAVENKRSAFRKRVDIPCALRMPTAVYSGRLLDISLGGAFIQTKQPLSIGTKFSVIFKAHAGTKQMYLNFHAEAIHSGRFLLEFENFYGIGARFIKLTRKHAEDLVFLINNLGDEPPQRKFEMTC